MLIPEFSFQWLTTRDAQCSLLRRLSTVGLVSVSLLTHQLQELAPLDQKPQDLTLKTSLLDTRTLLGPFSIEMLEIITMWLDQGIKKVLIDTVSSEDVDLERVVIAVSELPANRVIVRLPVSSLDSNQVMKLAETLNEIEDYCKWKSVDEGYFFAVEMSTGPREGYHYESVFAKIKELHHKNIHIVAPGYCYEEGEKKRDLVMGDGQVVVDAALSFVQCLRTDRPDGLFTTVVADEAGIALGLVYSSAESIVAALESGRGVYYSRSRGGLWKKGESSGNAQSLIQIDMDCDSDALRFTVNQTGAGFCHLNTRTCWGHDGGLRALENMLSSRHENAPAGSYTKRLFEDAELLRNKLVEEAQELAEAESISDVAGEAADVMYFAMVRCVAAGCKLSDVEKMLDKRALKVKRRPGNSKAYRIAAANEILNTKDDS
ncbi:unnamed protein product [Peronospora farinosa]|uniref:Phosphoribosyl-AMP cyclohydrolase domain-containing protein n=1 Tax=Peronospora farinosa TaxID=134698 RepID=A0AAV0TQ95_9STRA|nr:unnamed protein product [Peronospora farinosa]